MKFYKAIIQTTAQVHHFDNSEEHPALFEEFGRKVLVRGLWDEEITRERRNVTIEDASMFCESSARDCRECDIRCFDLQLYQYPIFIASLRLSSSESEVIETVYEACRLWGIKYIKVVRVETYPPTDWRHWNVSVYETFNQLDISILHKIANNTHLHIYKDWVIQERNNQKDCLEAVAGTKFAKPLAKEAPRMTPRRGGYVGMPVHYVLEGTESADFDEALHALLEMLNMSHRVPSRLAMRFDCNSFCGIHGDWLDSGTLNESLNVDFALAIAGNVIVLKYGDFDDDENYDEKMYSFLCKFVEMLRPFLENTLLVFAIPSGKPYLAKRVKKLLKLPVSVISPSEAANAQLITREEACAQLESMAAKDGIVPDESLYLMLKKCMQDQSFNNLEQLYADWRRRRLIEGDFPEYLCELREAMEINEAAEPDGLQSLDELIGLVPVKQKIREILARFTLNREVAKEGLPVQPFSMHLAFVGAPGTGKTEVARLYGQILKDAGVLSEGRVVSVSGPAMGLKNVTKIFDKARGSVLFVDEAYAMAGQPDTVAEFIACMENRRNDTVVILAGYEHEMEGLMKTNPGFRSRLGFILKFPEYSRDELLDIFMLMCNRARLVLEEDTKRSVRDLLARNGRRADQGNARYARKLFEDMLGAQQVRLAKEYTKSHSFTAEELSTVLVEDVEKAGGLSQPNAEEKSSREALDDLVGLPEVKRLVKERIDFMRIQQARRDAGLPAPDIAMHMAFLGAPGTGKTEVARLMGRILRDEGVLSVGDFYELAGNKLLSPMAGVGSAAVRDLFAQARGSVVLIDEAYSLMPQSSASGEEVVAAIIDEMEKLRDEVVVIFAGYRHEIEQLFKSNPGFASRVGVKIDFPDYAPDELVEIFIKMSHDQGFAVADDCLSNLREIMKRATAVESFGNARFARNLLESALLRQSSRLAKTLDAAEQTLSIEALTTIMPEDIAWEAPKLKNPLGFCH